MRKGVPDKYLEKIDEYIFKRLSERSANKLEQEITNNENLEKLVLEHEQLIEQLRFFFISRKVSKIHQSAVKNHGYKKKIKKYKKVSLITTSICSFLLFFALILFSSIDKEKVIKDSYVPFSSVYRDVDREMSMNKKVLYYYSIEDYSNCLNIYEEGHKLTDKAKLAVGNAYFQQNNFEKAETVFSEIVSKGQKNPIWGEYAEWYLYNTYIMAEKFNNAFSLLMKIYDAQDHSFKEQASYKKIINTLWLKSKKSISSFF